MSKLWKNKILSENYQQEIKVDLEHNSKVAYLLNILFHSLDGHY